MFTVSIFFPRWFEIVTFNPYFCHLTNLNLFNNCCRTRLRDRKKAKDKQRIIEAQITKEIVLYV